MQKETCFPISIIFCMNCWHNSRLYLIKNFAIRQTEALIPLSHHTFLILSFRFHSTLKWWVWCHVGLFNFFSLSISCSKLIERRKIEQRILGNLTFIKLWIGYLKLFSHRILWYFSKSDERWLGYTHHQKEEMERQRFLQTKLYSLHTNSLHHNW